MKRTIRSVYFFGILAFLNLGFSYPSFSQTSKSRVRQGSGSTDSIARIEQKLVDLALNGPLMDASLHQSKINEYQLKAAKNTWINILSLSANYNDQSFKKQAGPNTYIYPKYFFGLTIPLGTILSQTQIKLAREQISISIDNQEELKRNIKSEVLSKYREYTAYNQLIAMQVEMLNDVQTALLQNEDRFKKGIITFDQYNTAQRGKNDEASKLINLQLHRDILKFDLERMIGTSLESVVRS